MANIFRAFIAVSLPKDVRAALGNVSTDLAATADYENVRWVKSERLHLTLRFLGETPLESIPTLSRALDEVVDKLESFNIVTGPPGYFPNAKRPRVIYVALEEHTNQPGRLLQLKTSIDLALEPLGWHPETRPFTAHLTLGRVKDGRRPGNIAVDAAVPALTVPVTAVHLIESELRPEGPNYTIRHTSRLSS